MSRRYDGKSDEDLILDDKLDIARTILALNSRRELRHEKNRVETFIKQSHREEVNSGKVVNPTLPSGDDILNLYGASAPALGTGDAKTGDTASDA